MKYSTKDLCARYNITRSRLHQLRSGYTSSRGTIFEALLIEDKEWIWKKGDIEFKESAVKKLDKFFETKKARTN